MSDSTQFDITLYYIYLSSAHNPKHGNDFEQCFHLWYIVSHILLMEGLNMMPRGLKVSRLLITDKILFINKTNDLK